VASTCTRRVTRPGFRLCSARPPHSQAPFCPYTLLRAVAIRAEGTIGRLRYLLGGDRPSQTPRLPVSSPPIRGWELGTRPRQSGISPLPPPSPQGGVLWLPPILRRHGLVPVTRWSKAPRGLFVLPHVARIFTGTSISPGPRQRQRSTRYSIRAGRNLPDKEFRYLRTIIVIAAVHQGFGSGRLKALPLTVWHRAGVSPHTSPRGFAETCVFGKQSVEPIPCVPLTLGAQGPTRPGEPLLPKLRG
jgi:hypothetical protein